MPSKATIRRWEQEQTVIELICGFETMDDDEFEEKYDSLSPKYQRKVDDAALDFADDAIGDTSWRSDW